MKAKQATAAGEIDVNDEAQCIHWTHELGVTAGELKAAVHHVGPKAEEVRRYIKGKNVYIARRNVGSTESRFDEGLMRLKSAIETAKPPRHAARPAISTPVVTQERG